MNREGELAQAVDRFFDRAAGGLPVFVPAMPSLLAGTAGALVVFLIGGRVVREERNRYLETEDLTKRYRWVVLLGVLLLVCGYVSDAVQNKVYTFSNVALNRQHFANVHWLKVYKTALFT